MAKLYLLCGPAGCGKSTWAKNRKEKIVSRDEIRFKLLGNSTDYFSKEKEVFLEYIANINTSLQNGEDVIADATHLTPNSRAKVIKKLTAGNVEIIPVWFNCTLEKCLEQNEHRTGMRYVPPRIITEMFLYGKHPKYDEIKYSNIIEVN